MLWIITFNGISVKADEKALEAYNKGISMLFTQNVGQLSDEVLFYSLHPSVVYVLRDGTIHINGVKVSFKSKPRFITGDMQLITKVSYFGRNKSISGIPTYKRVVLKEVYPKIDAILTADGRGIVEFQFIVHPGGDPEDIRVETDGDIVQREDGIYIVKGGKEVVRISGLKAYQGAEEVEVRVDVKGKEAKFIVDDWDRKHTLVIDPVATAILTSSDVDVGISIAIDSTGDIFISGMTWVPDDFAPSRTIFGTPGGIGAFVSKLSNDLGTHIATAILTSSADDVAYSISISNFYASNSVIVVGGTNNSYDFAPSRVVFGTTGGSDVFVSKLSNDLLTHVATAILASSSLDWSYSVAIDSSGNVFVAGYTRNSGDFAPSRTIFGTPGGDDVFISKLSNDLGTHIATAILASNNWDWSYSIAIDNLGDVLVAGYTHNSSGFAPSRTVFGTPSPPGTADAFVSKLSNDLSTHIATAILTSSSGDGSYSVAIDNSGSVFVAGRTGNSNDFAPSRTVFGTPGSWDVFVSKLSNDLTTHIATAILASNNWDNPYSITIDNSGNVFVAGETKNSYNFAPNRTVFGTPNGPDTNDAFVSKLANDLSTHIATVILTSSNDDGAFSITIDSSGNIYVSGWTWNSSNFSLSRIIFGTTGWADAFISKLPSTLNISETPKPSKDANIEISKGTLIFNLHNSSYLGFDVYDASGKIVKRVSLGYLPPGRYEYKLNLPKGVYTVKVRVGANVERLKGVF